MLEYFSSLSCTSVNCCTVKTLWQEVAAWLGSLDVRLTLDHRILLFGHPDQPSDSILNYVILSVKYFIWISKQKDQNINTTTFKKYFYHKLFELKNAYIYIKNKCSNLVSGIIYLMTFCFISKGLYEVSRIESVLLF